MTDLLVPLVDYGKWCIHSGNYKPGYPLHTDASMKMVTRGFLFTRSFAYALQLPNHPLGVPWSVLDLCTESRSVSLECWVVSEQIGKRHCTNPKEPFLRPNCGVNKFLYGLNCSFSNFEAPISSDIFKINDLFCNEIAFVKLHFDFQVGK